ncbi:FkbM family methyltransferase [Poriferisphaera sp. WC338]|uniref:FkbM family methyltransferase n=1 Tax=Poriferisphaera sp. WC338 TaxID=3425129 RepID=UPI003D81682F
MNNSNNNFYSQHGEDILAHNVLTSASEPNYFVEVGMIDGKRFSNTLALEERGWSGLCIEAHPQYVDMVRQNRPGSAVIHAAASDKAGDNLPFYADPRGDLSSLQPRDESELKERFGHWFQGYDVVNVPVRTLNDMFYEAGVPQNFDLLSIDIEGGELDALKGLDLNVYRPRMMILEADDITTLHSFNNYLIDFGYRHARTVGVNAIYTRTVRDLLRVHTTRIHDNVTHTAHPIDNTVTEQTYIPSAYETRSQFASRIIRSFFNAA